MADDELESYENFIAHCAEYVKRGETSRIIYNRSPVHAAVLIRYLIQSAEREVRILSGELNHGVYGDPRVIKAAVEFLHRGGHLRVLLDLNPSSLDPYITLGDLVQTNSLLSALFAAMREEKVAGHVEVRMVPAKVAAQYPFHCLVADAASFRFEEDRQKMDAIAQFGNERFALALKTRFEQIWALSQQ